MSKKLAIVASRSGVDGAYPPFVLTSTAASMGYECRVFCTFGGLELLKHSPDVAQPESQGANEVVPFEELRQMSIDSGVQLIACQMSMDMLGIAAEDLIEGVDFAGAASWLEFASEADVSLYI